LYKGRPDPKSLRKTSEAWENELAGSDPDQSGRRLEKKAKKAANEDEKARRGD